MISFVSCRTSRALPYREAIPPLVAEGAHATALFVSGLNNGGAVFRQARELLHEQGISSLELCLHDNVEVKNLEQWREQVRRGYEYACSLGRPIIGVGFSTGALLLLDALHSLPCEPPARLVLLSPPFKVNFRSKLVRLFFPLRHLGVSIPSFAPRMYRARSWTSILSYHSLFRLIESSGRVPLPEGLEIHALFNPDDEFLDVEGSIEIFEELTSGFGHTYRILNTTQYPSHLLLDETTLGEKGWPLFIKLLTKG